MSLSHGEFDRLLENTRWVRALGVELAGGGDGEDVAQDAWVLALERSENRLAPAAWLSGVVRHLAARRRRARTRRAFHERAAARPEAQPGADELVAEAELSRQLILALTELEEPFRSTLLRRFYRGETPEEIARGQGVPTATVRTRLHRGLAKLRARFDREHGGRAAWTFVFGVGEGGGAQNTVTILGGTLLGVKTMTAVAGALVVLAGLILWGRGGWGSGAGGAEAASIVGGRTPAARLTPPELESTEDAGQREPLAASSAASAGASELSACALFGRVMDEAGSPIVPWTPWVSLTDAAGVRVQARVSEDGSFSLAGLSPGPRRLSVGAVGYRALEEDLELASESSPLHRDFVLRSAVRLPVKLVTTSGELLREALKARTESWHDDSLFPFPVATLDAPGAEIPAALDRGNEQVGVGNLWDYGPLWEAARKDCSGVLVLTCDLPVFVSLTQGARVLQTQRVEPGASEVVFVVDPETLFAGRGAVQARLVSEDCHRLLAGRIELEPSNQFFDVPEGVWQQDLGPGRYTAQWQAPEHAAVTRTFTLAPGQELDLGEVVLPVERTIEGRITDADGRPVFARLRVGHVDPAGRVSFPDTRFHEADESGHYRIGGLASGDYVLRTIGDDEVRFPAREEPATTWVCGNLPVSTRGGSVSGFDIRLERAGILVLKGAEALPSEARITVLDARGDELRATRYYAGFVPRFVLPPGTCTLLVRDPEGVELARRAVEIGPEVCVVDLSL